MPLQPELCTDEDLEYMRKKFLLDKNDEQAKAEFTRLIDVSLNAFMTNLNWAVHIAVHARK
jgi:hypothetical protein